MNTSDSLFQYRNMGHMLVSLTNKSLKIAKKILKNNSIYLYLQKIEYEKYFATAENTNLFKGVFSTFEEAALTAPATKNIGYDNPETTNMYQERVKRIYSTDYPVLFWLDRLFKKNNSIFDLGGHVGVSFYSYQKLLLYPENLDWKVCDVENVTKFGEQLANNQKSKGLSFTNDYKLMSGYDILFCSGSLQYIEEPISKIINLIDRKPKHVIVNLLPLYNGKSFVTLQNIGSVFCPYQIFNKQLFLESLHEIGYKLVDIWENPEKTCQIPFYPNNSLDKYWGAYFTLENLDH
jgi:putative methyltransferase (TIGR04325 family)